MLTREPGSSAWLEYREQLLSALPPREARVVKAWSAAFYQFQLEWLFEPLDYALALKSRQTGFSHTTSALLTLWGAMLGETSTVISVGQREANEVLVKARLHSEVLCELGSKWARITGRDSQEEIVFASGGRVIALPQSSGGRSFSGNVFLDEFAYAKDADKVWDGAAAVTMHGYKMRVASTPNGTGGEFHRLCTVPEAGKGWIMHVVDIDRAIRDGMDVDMEKCWTLAKGDQALFDQLFRCKFLDSQAQYIPTSAIKACQAPFIPVEDGPCFAGLDIGRTNDLTALVVLQRAPSGVANVLSIRTAKRTDDVALNNLIAWAFQRYNVKRLCVDETGMGAFPVDAMRRRWGRARVEGVSFTQQSKEDLATTMYSAFIEEALRIPQHDKATNDIEPGGADSLSADVASLRRIITSAGNVRYDAPRTVEGHGDLAWALALALHAAARPQGHRREETGRQWAGIS